MGRASRIVLAVAAVDCLASGLCAIAFVNAFLAWLQLPPLHIPEPHQPALDDRGFLLLTLGYLNLANAGCLIVAAVRPDRYRGLALVAGVGRLLCCGMWAWLLATDHIKPAHEPLYWLLAHDAFWLVALTVVLVVPFTSRRR